MSQKPRPVEFEVDKNGCFICTSHKARTKDAKYTATRIIRGGKTTTMPRWIYAECFGELPPGIVVRHKCDNGLCINPEHLESGTQKQNTDDMIERGRNKNGPRILDESKAKAIRLMLSAGHTAKDIAAAYGVSISAIRDIKQNRRWTEENLKRREVSERLQSLHF